LAVEMYRWWTFFLLGKIFLPVVFYSPSAVSTV
jgi:hypothetical protein